MDITDLQTRLAQLDHLLPSQREWLERLLFQLAFNDHQLISILGSAGSGKSTLALAIAELLSDQYNIALLDTSVSKTAATKGRKILFNTGLLRYREFFLGRNFS